MVNGQIRAQSKINDKFLSLGFHIWFFILPFLTFEFLILDFQFLLILPHRLVRIHYNHRIYCFLWYFFLRFHRMYSFLFERSKFNFFSQHWVKFSQFPEPLVSKDPTFPPDPLVLSYPHCGFHTMNSPGFSRSTDFCGIRIIHIHHRPVILDVLFSEIIVKLSNKIQNTKTWDSLKHFFNFSEMRWLIEMKLCMGNYFIVV